MVGGGGTTSIKLKIYSKCIMSNYNCFGETEVTKSEQWSQIGRFSIITHRHNHCLVVIADKIR